MQVERRVHPEMMLAATAAACVAAAASFALQRGSSQDDSIATKTFLPRRVPARCESELLERERLDSYRESCRAHLYAKSCDLALAGSGRGHYSLEQRASGCVALAQLAGAHRDAAVRRLAAALLIRDPAETAAAESCVLTQDQRNGRCERNSTY